MEEETTNTKPKNWATKTVINRFVRKVAEVLGEDILDPTSPAREETVGDVLDKLILADLKADYGSDTIQLPGQTTVDQQIEEIEGI